MNNVKSQMKLFVSIKGIGTVALSDTREENEREESCLYYCITPHVRTDASLYIEDCYNRKYSCQRESKTNTCKNNKLLYYTLIMPPQTWLGYTHQIWLLSDENEQTE